MLLHHLLSFGGPDRLTVFDQGRSYTYLDLRTLVRQCRNALYAQGSGSRTVLPFFPGKPSTISLLIWPWLPWVPLPYPSTAS